MGVSATDGDPGGDSKLDRSEEEGVEETLDCSQTIIHLANGIKDGMEKSNFEIVKGTFDKAVRISKGQENSANHRRESEEEISSFSGHTASAINASTFLEVNHANREVKRRGLKKQIRFEKILDFVGTTNHKWAQEKIKSMKEYSKRKTKMGCSEAIADTFNSRSSFSSEFLFSNKLRSAAVGINCYGNQSEESDIIRSNFRIWDKLDLNIGDEIWNSIANLGVVMEDNGIVYKKMLIQLEKKDRLRNEVLKGKSNNFQ